MIESLFNEAAVLRVCDFIKQCFPVKFANFLRTIILKNICKCLFLNVIYKETTTEVFSYEDLLFKNMYFVEDLQTTGSETHRGSLFNKVAGVTT